MIIIFLIRFIFYNIIFNEINVYVSVLSQGGILLTCISQLSVFLV